MKDDLIIYRRLMKYAKPYWKIMAIAVSGMVVSAALEPVLPALMGPLVDKSLIQKDLISMWQIPLLIIIAFGVKGVADYITNVASQNVAQRTIADLRSELFRHRLNLPLTKGEPEDGGRMLSRIVYDTSLVGEAVSSAWVTLCRDTLVLIGLLGFLLYTAWQLTLMVILLAPILALTIRILNQKIRLSSESVQTMMGRLSSIVQESLDAIKEIKVFGIQIERSEKFGKSNTDLRRQLLKVGRVQAVNVPLVQILAALSVASVTLLAANLSQNDLLSPGDFVAFITGMVMVFEPIRRLMNVNSTLQRGLVAAGGIFAVLDETTEEKKWQSRIDSISGPTDITNFPANPFRGLYRMDFEAVSFRYPSQEKWALRDLSFNVVQGQTLVITGPSGAGKSTVFNLICGFYDLSEGRITINGVNTNSIPLHRLRGLVSGAPQPTSVFDMTIRENLLLADSNASDERLWHALELADASNFVEGLPLKLNTPLYQRGRNLSLGQLQRLTVARAFLKDVPILLLDEPTNGLDEASEMKIFENIKIVSRDKITIIVTHSPERIAYRSQLIEIC